MAASPSASASPVGNGAAGCTGTAGNRAFYASLAARVRWDVYCAVLPAHWFVDTGTFSGGVLEISYKGPSGARLTLREGPFCGAAHPCPPPGVDAGPASFGPVTATIYVGSDGAGTVFAQAGSVAWEAEGTGTDQAQLGRFAAALILVTP